MAVEGIGKTIDRLQRLAKLIRKVSAANLELRAQGFASKRQADKNAQEDEADRLFERTVKLFIKGLYPDISSSLAQQLVASIVERRLRFLWQRRHQRKLEQSSTRPESDESLAHRMPDLSTRDENQKSRVDPDIKPTASTSFTPKPETKAVSNTELSVPPQRISIPSLPAIQPVSRPPTTASFDFGHYPYPKAPDIPPVGSFCKCSWCGDLLEVSKLEEPHFWKYVLSRSCFEYYQHK